ncbi:MAG TPA: ADP-ribosylglycohydrolase family protein [Candidatus Glassbacteria bacterium]|nr:ADP-ribosylglycohydrolase family protein [Candidatus Glassbacteria bacterium]
MKNPNFLLHIGMADAYGCAVEFVDYQKHTEHFKNVLKFDQYYERPQNKGWPGKGRFSDDTALSIACAEVVRNNPYPFSSLDFANAFVDVFHRDYRQGYARGFQTFMEMTHSGQEFLDRISPNSDKNGACMRAIPVGALTHEEQVLRTAELQAKITHDTSGGIFSSQAVALVSHYALYDKGPMNKKELGRYLSQYFDMRPFEKKWTWEVVGPNLGVKTFHAVYELVTSGLSMMETLRQAILLSGDVDSVAAISCGIASFRDEGKDIPEWMYWGLEPGRPYGVYFLQMLGEQLMEIVDV